MQNYFTVENILLVVMLVVIALGIWDRYKRAKADDGKVDMSEMLGILLSANSDIADLIKMADDSIKVKTKQDKQKYVADHLGDVINKANFLTDGQKELFHSFGMENIAKIIVPDKEPEKIESPKEESSDKVTK